MPSLKGKKVAILSDSGFEELELTSPKKALEEAGAVVEIVSAQKDTIRGWNHDHWSIELNVDINIDDAKTENYDALMIPGGVINSDQMRLHTNYIQFAEEFLEAGKPVATICHGPQLLIETGMISGREMTSFPSIKTDLINAGATWQDKEVVTDNGLITSRSPKDLEAFNKKMIEEIAEGKQASKAAFTQPRPVTQP